MNAKRKKGKKTDKKAGLYPFRASVVRGLGVVMPPLLTIVIFLWVGSTVQTKVLQPVTGWTRDFLHPWLAIPCFLSLFLLLLYLLGKFIAASIGRFFWGLFERAVGQVPLVSNVYGAVKQVSDLFLQEHELEYSRIVAVEWPRKGIWSVALVTGESMVDIEAAANEPVLSVLIPNSPAPITGFTLTVKKSETIDLNISLDQAIQFIVSCGVVVPPGQVRKVAAKEDEPEQLAAPDDSAESEADEPE